jgi:hypothetical protein
MTDVAIGEAPAEPVPPVGPAPDAAALPQAAVPEVEPPACAEPVPPAPEAIAEVETAAPQAAAVGGLAPATDQADRSASVDAVAAPSADALAERALPFDVDHLGPLRRAVLDALVDADEPLSVSRILAEMPPGTTRGNVESAIKRNFDAGLIERVGAGLYVLGKPKPPKPAEPPRPPPVAPEDEQVWLAAFEAWIVGPDSWDRTTLGPRPDEPGRRIPADIVARGVDRSRKRQERRREAEAAAAKRSAADAELRSKLLAACNGNFQPGPGLDDLSPIKSALEIVPLARVLTTIRYKVDKRSYPANPTLVSWRNPVLLKEIAENYCGSEIVPRLVAAWSVAGKAPATKAQSLQPDGEMLDIDELRRRHDSEHEPAGPHVMPLPDAALDVLQEAAGASEALPAVQVPPEQESAPETPPANGSAPSGDSVAEPASDPPEAAAPPGAVGREQVLAAFARNRTLASPPPAAPEPRPAEKPWFAGPRVPQQEREMTDEGWRFVLSGYVAGNLAWAAKHGPPPRAEGCRVPTRILREFRL